MYQVLPSYVNDHATTFDLMVVDVMTAWEENRDKKVDPSSYREEDLQKMLDKVRK